jgi:hypothetical protein
VAGRKTPVTRPSRLRRSTSLGLKKACSREF